MKKYKILRVDTIVYPSENRKRKLYVLECPKCGGEQSFRKHMLPECAWVCKSCHKKRHRVTINCSHCGKEKTIPLSKIKNSRRGLHFCNRACKEAQQKVGGLLELPHYGVDGSTTYRKLAFRTYGKRCGICGIDENHMLVVHHIDGNRKNNDVDNLEVLCRNHHADRHKKLLNGEWVFDTKQLYEEEDSGD